MISRPSEKSDFPYTVTNRTDRALNRFFNDLLSQGWPAPFWHTMRVFYDGDGYAPLGLYFKFFDVVVGA